MTRLLLNRKVGIIVSIIAIACKCLLMFYFSFVGRDKGLQLAAAKNLISGRGLTTTVYYLNDIYTPIFLPLHMWPPGYSIFISPLLFVFKDNYYLVTALFDCIFAIFFIIINRKLLSLVNVSYVGVNLFTLFSGFFLYNFTSRSYPTDLAALCFFLTGIFFLVKLFSDSDSLKPGYSFFAACSLFIASLFRYMYIPVVMGVILAALAIALLHRNRRRLIDLAIVFGINLALTGGMLMLLKMFTGEAAYIKETETGFYIENLSSWSPAGLSAFINIDFYCLQAEKILNIGYTSCLLIMHHINIIIYLVLAVLAVAFVRKFLIKKSRSNADIYMVLGLAAVVSLFAELIFLSVTNRAQGTWNYIEGGRYYAFMILFIQHVFFIWAFPAHSKPQTIFTKSVLILIGLLCLLEILHGIYFSTKVATRFSVMKAQIKQEQDYVFFERLCRNIRKETPGKDILVASEDEYFRSMASLLDNKGIKDVTNLNGITPRVHKPAILITIMIKKTRDNYKNYISRKDVTFFKKIGDAEFYLQELDAR